ncbi:MAG TPA: alpha/beta hydrolase [Candidatus Tectomicrobia bacterium]|nr:alpha/beta hydrolase [Candidatus Tectomicrobia bacterium]
MSANLACQTARRRALTVGGVRLHALEWGASGRPAICFLHGGAAHAHWFDAVAGAFADRFHVVSLDQRGHGESAWVTPPAYGTEHFAGDLLGALDALGWERATLVGHSMGGHNAMTFAAWHPTRVERLVIVDSRPAIPPDRLETMHARGRRPRRVHATRDAAIASFRLLPRETVADPALMAHLAAEAIARRDGGWALRFDPETSAARRPVDAWPLLPKIAAPTLIVRGELSPILPPPMAADMLRLIPDARLVEIPGAYHHLVLDRPGEFVAALEGFLSGGGW